MSGLNVCNFFLCIPLLTNCELLSPKKDILRKFELGTGMPGVYVCVFSNLSFGLFLVEFFVLICICGMENCIAAWWLTEISPNSVVLVSLSDFEVYLKSKIAEVQHARALDEEKASCYSDPHGVLHRPYASARYAKLHLIDSHSLRKSIASGSKASVYFTPNDSVDQAQLQLSPMHINYIRENLDTYVDCIKPAAADTKFDIDMHRLQASLEQEINRRRSQQFRQPSDEYDSAVDDTNDFDTEHTRMLNQSNDNGAAPPMAGHCIRMNTLPKRKNRRSTKVNDLFYSLENVFDGNANDSDLEHSHRSSKTIDEATETLLTSSASDNCSSGEAVRALGPSQSVLVLNEMSAASLGERPSTCNSMPNILDATDLSHERSTDDIQCNRIGISTDGAPNTP